MFPATSNVTPKGQVTIPPAMRKQLQIEPGTQVQFRLKENDTIEISVIHQSIEDAFGLLKSSRSVSVGEMNQTIEQQASSLHD
jgi:AbrB family looped-hinge helix DNA binding protein